MRLRGRSTPVAAQNFTEAKMESLRAAGCRHEFMTLEAAVADYVRGYLSANNACLSPTDWR